MPDNKPRIRQYFDNGQVLVPIEELQDAEDHVRLLLIDRAETERERVKAVELEQDTARRLAAVRADRDRLQEQLLDAKATIAFLRRQDGAA